MDAETHQESGALTAQDLGLIGPHAKLRPSDV